MPKEQEFIERKCSALNCELIIKIPVKNSKQGKTPKKEGLFGFYCQPHAKQLNDHLTEFKKQFNTDPVFKNKFIEQVNSNINKKKNTQKH